MAGPKNIFASDDAQPIRPSAEPSPAASVGETKRSVSRSTLSYGFVWPFVFVVLVFLFGWYPLNGSTDLFSHAAVGRWIVEHHAIPRHTLFLWSLHVPWIAHSWLGEVVCYALLSAGPVVGPALCVSACIGGCSAAFLLLWAARNPKQPIPWLLPVLFAMGILSASGRFQPRPDVVTSLFTALLLSLFSLAMGSDAFAARLFGGPRKTLTLAGGFALFALWTNLHGGVITGIVLIAIVFAGTLLQRRLSLRYQDVGLLLAACLAGMLVNPYGLRYFSIYAQVSSPWFRVIDEWIPPYLPPIVPFVLIFTGLVGLAGLICITLRRPFNIVYAGWWLFGLASYCDARRNIFTFVMTSLIAVASQSDLLVRFENAVCDPTRVRSTPSMARRLGPALCHIIAIGIVGSYADFPTRPNPWALISPSAPTGQANYLIARGIRGRLFNDGPAAYLEWRLYGHNEFFIDGLSAYGKNLAKPRADAMGGDYQTLLDKNQVDCVVGRIRPDWANNPPPLYGDLNGDPRWRRVYNGSDGSVWTRLATHH